MATQQARWREPVRPNAESMREALVTAAPAPEKPGREVGRTVAGATVGMGAA